MKCCENPPLQQPLKNKDIPACRKNGRQCKAALVFQRVGRAWTTLYTFGDVGRRARLRGLPPELQLLIYLFIFIHARFRRHASECMTSATTRSSLPQLNEVIAMSGCIPFSQVSFAWLVCSYRIACLAGLKWRKTTIHISF